MVVSKGNNLELLLESPVAIYTCDVKGVIQIYNKAAVELWGRAPEAGKDQWCGSWKIYRPDGTPLPLDQCPMAIILKGGKVSPDVEIIIERPDGSRRHVIPHPQPILDLSGAITGAANMLVDITDSKIAETNSARLAAIIRSSSDAIISKTLDGIITSWNPAAERLFGYKCEEMIGQHITKLIPPDRLNEEPMIIDRLKKGERVDHFETKRMTKDGELIDISLTISPVRDKKDKIIGASKIARNITEDLAIRKKIEESEVRFRTITDVSPVGLWMTDEHGKTNFVNKTWIQWTGIPLEKQYGDGWLEAVIEADKDYIAKKFEQSFLARENFSAEFKIKRNDGKLRWVLSEASPYYTIEGDFAGYAGSVSDVTERKQEELRKNEFFAVASHELKTPLTAIKAYAQLLSSTSEKTNDVFLKNGLFKMESQVNKMTKLIGDFLNLSKIEADKLELNKKIFTINDLVNEIAEDIQMVSVNHKIVVEKADIVKVKADSEKIAQVIANFLTNAVKYSPVDKDITIMVGQENGNAKVSVSDKGPGIKQEEQDKVFERFYRSESNNNTSISGFGIGLYISAEIVQRHNGKIGVSCNEGEGATFYFTLPLVDNSVHLHPR